jgi:hypothetical protein
VRRADIQDAIGLAVAYEEPPNLTADEDRVFTVNCGRMPGFPKAFATPSARNRRLGPFRRTVDFAPTTYSEIKQASFAAHGVAIGHRFGEDGFKAVSAAVLPALAARIRSTGDCVGLVVNRARYSIAPMEDSLSIRHLGQHIADEELAGTIAWIVGALLPLLPTGNTVTEAN